MIVEVREQVHFWYTIEISQILKRHSTQAPLYQWGLDAQQCIYPDILHSQYQVLRGCQVEKIL